MITIKTVEGTSTVNHFAYEVARLASHKYPATIRSAKAALRSAMLLRSPNGSGRSYASYGVHMGCFSVTQA